MDKANLGKKPGAGAFAALYDATIKKDADRKAEANKEEIKKKNIDNNNNLPITSILPNPDQPRKHFDKEKYESLKASIQARGVDTPIIVRPANDKPGKYYIVAGERRWRCCSELGTEQIPVVVKVMDEKEAFIVSITENVQREDFHWLDECESYTGMIEKGCAKTQKEISELIGIPQQRVSERLSVANLPEQVKEVIYATPKFSIKYAVALLPVKNTNQMVSLVKKIKDGTEDITLDRFKREIEKAVSPEKLKPQKSSFQCIQRESVANGWNFVCKYRKDRPEDIVRIRAELKALDGELEKIQAGI